MGVKKPFYKRKWFIIFAVIMMIGIAGNMEDAATENAQSGAVAEQKEEVMAEETVAKDELDIATMEMTDENIRKAVEGMISKYENIEVTYEETEEGMTLDVFYYEDNPFSDQSMIKDHTRNAVKIYRAFFENPQVDKIWVWGETKFLDDKGNESKDYFANVSMIRETAEQINWENFSDMVYAEYNRLYEVSDSFFIHPGVQKNLK